MDPAHPVLAEYYAANGNGLQIPSCDDKRTLQISDLHSGLRSIYTVRKKALVGCQKTLLPVQGQRQSSVGHPDSDRLNCLCSFNKFNYEVVH